MIKIGNFSFFQLNESHNSVMQETNIICFTILLEYSVSCVEDKLGEKLCI